MVSALFGMPQPPHGVEAGPNKMPQSFAVPPQSGERCLGTGGRASTLRGRRANQLNPRCPSSEARDSQTADPEKPPASVWRMGATVMTQWRGSAALAGLLDGQGSKSGAHQKNGGGLRDWRGSWLVAALGGRLHKSKPGKRREDQRIEGGSSSNCG